MSGIRLIGKYRIIAAMMGLTVFLAGAISGVTLIARTALHPLDIEIPSKYQPGQVLPSDIPRFREYYRSYTNVTGYVQRSSTSLDYIIEVDMPGRTIRHVSKWIFDSHITIGDLIVRWGPPTGRRGSFVSWSDRSAFVLADTDHMLPTSQVYFISYGYDPQLEANDPWLGFSRSEDDINTVSLQKLASLVPIKLP